MLVLMLLQISGINRRQSYQIFLANCGNFWIKIFCKILKLW